MGGRFAGVQQNSELDTNGPMKEPGPVRAESYPSLPYVIPFFVFFVFLALHDYLSFLGQWEYPFRSAILLLVLWVFSRHVIDLRVRSLILSVLIGIAVFAIWIAPDLLSMAIGIIGFSRIALRDRSRVLCRKSCEAICWFSSPEQFAQFSSCRSSKNCSGARG